MCEGPGGTPPAGPFMIVRSSDGARQLVSANPFTASASFLTRAPSAERAVAGLPPEGDPNIFIA